MKQFEVYVRDPVGIHARPAGLLVKQAQGCTSEIKMECRGKEADMKRLFSVMSLGAKNGDLLTVTLTGENAEDEARELRAFMEKYI